ncbi:uncharacterized protein DUF885 [Sphingobacterium allocomposti]|uniref:Uncharacterized protein DUF885 n=1 Tax=Sphingobacterium allocomposti TaxID=415956 RepID=A0A5S5DMT3_9SPHI|nr:DUF885 family protein [Sphingobacterium composti Yoo et al. 2007 non Ten et al. 2007]TYP96356.1 uncharacterized protein DUF885 [Sphingobacterium composti Yoo et al. 2007 non Ten et al. 2007]
MKRLYLYVRKTTICFFLTLLYGVIMAQKYDLYHHTTPIEPLIVQYGHDVQAVNYFYGPMPKGWGSQPAAASPEQLQRLLDLDRDYLDKLKAFPFGALNTNGQVDFVLLNRRIKRDITELTQRQSDYNRLAAYLPFAEEIFAFEKLRRRGANVQGQAIAGMLEEASRKVDVAKEKLATMSSLPYQDVNFLKDMIQSLSLRLTSSYDFYNEYEPSFTWWVPAAYKRLTEQLNGYMELLSKKSDWKVFDDGSQIGGTPIGRNELNRLLKEEMIAYSADDLLRLADQEFAWCEAELLKASQEMGFGNDWKAAQEKVKNAYVPVGQQPELILRLYNEAQEFIRENELMDIPPLADETWGMIMMTPERQLVNPFFTGGREISISYPTIGMTQEQKLMSMRGNNPYFSRGTVQHELNPGHHLQYFMNRRHKPYRERAFNTPFWTEGWTLYWELLLYSKGFAKTPEERIGMLFWRMHRCARITFSIKFHLGEWTPQQCIDYLVDRVGFEPANAHGEVKRSFEGSYGPLYQLAYLVGGLQLMRIKHEVVDAGKMSYKEFHDKVIKENYMPMEMLRAILTDQQLSPDHEASWKFYTFK